MLTDKEKEALQRSDLIIEGNTATWEMRMEGEVQGTYAGSFRFKCYLSPLQQIAANREYREILGPNPGFADEHASFLAYALTQLKHRIIAAPPFWASQSPAVLAGDLPDDSVIAAVLDAALGSEIKYRSQLKAKKLEAVARAEQALNKAMNEDEDADDDADDEDESEEK